MSFLRISLVHWFTNILQMIRVCKQVTGPRSRISLLVSGTERKRREKSDHSLPIYIGLILYFFDATFGPLVFCTYQYRPEQEVSYRFPLRS